jgi:hypothetical protein
MPLFTTTRETDAKDLKVGDCIQMIVGPDIVIASDPIIRWNGDVELYYHELGEFNLPEPELKRTMDPAEIIYDVYV